jgi:hypothetical protein
MKENKLKFNGKPKERENGNSPSASGFPECQISGTRGRNSSPSVALREEMHSGKRVFPECLIVHDTRGREALEEANLFPECLTLALWEASLFPECLVEALGEEFFCFLFFSSFFLKPSHII